MPFQATLSTIDIVNSLPLEDAILRAEQLGCLSTSAAMQSSINTDGEPINFNAGTVLGLPNPLEFEVDAVRWEVRSGGI